MLRERTGRTLRKMDSFPFVYIEKKRFLTVRMDIINRCNLRCKMCYFRLDEIRNAPLSSMSIKLFRKIAHEVFPITKHFIFSAGAEPLMSANFPEMLAILPHYHLPYISFFTNGMLLNENIVARLIDTKIHEIHFSIDGATKGTYEAIREGADFEQVLGNVKRLQELKMSRQSRVPKVSFQIVLMRRNIQELPQYVELAHNLGVENINASLLVPYQGLDVQDEVPDIHSDLLHDSLLQARILARQYGIHFAGPPGILEDFTEIDAPSLENRCHFPWTEILINPDGTIYPCCFWYENSSMGSFQHQTFEEIWQGALYTQLREELASGKQRMTCAQCPIFGITTRENAQESVPEIAIVRGV